MKQTSHTGFWDNSDYALKNYVCEPLTMELLMSVEDELGYKLPQFYIEMMKNQNGGLPVNTCFPTESSNSWAGDHVAITGIFGIGRDKPYSLCGNGGSQFMIEEWGYPEIGICICDCPSAGHDMIMLDYRKCGKDGEPQVVHVDQEGDYRITFVAETFEEFVRGLVNWEVFDTSEEDLKNKLHAIETGKYSDRLQDLLTKEGAFGEQMSDRLRKLLIELTTQKGYFALHADALSYLVYDVQFYLFAKHQIVKTGEQYLKEYPRLIALGNNDINTGGYAPGFVEDWLNKRIEENKIQSDTSIGLHFTHEFEKQILSELAKYQ